MKTKTFEVFYFTCNESKIYENCTFEISYKNLFYFFSICFRCTCMLVDFNARGQQGVGFSTGGVIIMDNGPKTTV